IIETPSLALRWAWARPRICPRRFSLMPSPAASSAACWMRSPEERRPILEERARWLLPTLRWAIIEAVLVVIVKLMAVPGIPCRGVDALAVRSLSRSGLHLSDSAACGALEGWLSSFSQNLVETVGVRSRRIEHRESTRPLRGRID